MAIKILKPIKHTRQKNETPTDAEGLLKFVSEIACGSDTKNDVRVVSNNICNPKDFINNPRQITEQMIEHQKSVGVEADCKGKRIYPMTYKLPKEKAEWKAKEDAAARERAEAERKAKEERERIAKEEAAKKAEIRAEQKLENEGKIMSILALISGMGLSSKVCKFFFTPLSAA